jgi:hypothetical protein
MVEYTSWSKVVYAFREKKQALQIMVWSYWIFWKMHVLIFVMLWIVVKGEGSFLMREEYFYFWEVSFNGWGGNVGSGTVG